MGDPGYALVLCREICRDQWGALGLPQLFRELGGPSEFPTMAVGNASRAIVAIEDVPDMSSNALPWLLATGNLTIMLVDPLLSPGIYSGA